MRRLAALLAVSLIAFAGCSTGQKTTLIQPDVELVQLVGPADQNYPRGSFEVQFGLNVANRSSEPIKLQQIQMAPVSTGGPYVVTRGTYYFNEEIAPNQTKEVEFWARAVGEGNQMAIDANAPVTVRAVALFDSSGGRFRKIMTRTFTQYGVGARGGQ